MKNKSKNAEFKNINSEKNKFYLRFIRTAILGVLALLPAFLLASCGQEEEVFANVFQVYYVNNEETGLVTREYQTNSTDMDELAAELLAALGMVSEKLEYKSPLAGGFELLDYSISEGRIVLNFDTFYSDQTVITEILVRAALVRTLTQVDGIDYVSILIQSEPLLDSMGNLVGVMAADMFINSAGDEIYDYEKTSLRLYFSDESGKNLVVATRSNVVYNSNVAIEKVVVENLIAGPVMGENVHPVINPATRIISITVVDGICYVNFDSGFLGQLDNVSADVTIYAITNSLVELPNINKVSISVNGGINEIFRENVSLSTIFERNLDLVTV